MIEKNMLVKSEELQEVNPLPKILDFWVEGCGPCILLGAFLDEISKKYERQIQIVKLNAVEATELQMRYHILSVPTLIFLKDDALVFRHVGFDGKNHTKEKIEDEIKKLLN
jgi:thioredoxin 1